MLTLSPETEKLVKTKAKETGKSDDQVIRDALGLVGEKLPWRGSDRRPVVSSKEEFFAQLDQLGARSAARPVVHPRNIDEIIGYDDFDIPR